MKNRIFTRIRKDRPRINREYKDRLFIFIFGREENKEWTLSLFNAVNGSDYDDPSVIEFNTLDNVLFMGMKNDVSFDAKLREKSDIEVSVRMININYGKNEALMKASNPLEGYSWFVGKIREYSRPLQKTPGNRRKKDRQRILANAVDKALNEMPEIYVIRDFLKRHRAEVAGMLQTEYDEKSVKRKFERQVERERERADKEQERADKAEVRIKELEAKLVILETQLAAKQ